MTAVSGPVFAWMLLDAETGQVLSEQNADVLTYPASLTKMMTLYLTFEALNQGRVRTDQLFTVSAYAASRSPSKLGLVPGEAVPLRDLILGLVTRSANDAASVIAENLAGSEVNFARYMTWKARQLGMQHTWYQNASGLPDPSQRTTARDVARLSLALYHDFPREYRYFSTQAFYFRGDEINTHNHLLEWYQGADGIKTGFVNASGFNIATSAVRNGRRLIGVIMGGRSAHSRDLQMASLLDQGFAVLGNRQPAQPLVAAAPAAGPRASSGSAIAAAAPAASAIVTATAPAPTVSAITAAAGPRASSGSAIAASATSPAIAATQAAPAPAARAIVPMEQVIAAVDDEEDDDESDARRQQERGAAPGRQRRAAASGAGVESAGRARRSRQDGCRGRLECPARRLSRPVGGASGVAPCLGPRRRERKTAAGSGAVESGSARAVSGPSARLQRERRPVGVRLIEKAQDRVHGGSVSR